MNVFVSDVYKTFQIGIRSREGATVRLGDMKTRQAWQAVLPYSHGQYLLVHVALGWGLLHNRDGDGQNVMLTPRACSRCYHVTS